MNDFTVTLRLETALLLGGPVSRELDDTHVLRPPSVRGLLHTFARALLGPMLNSDPAETRRAEGYLLGCSSGDSGEATFRVQDISGCPMSRGQGFETCPGREKGFSAGYSADQVRRLIFRPRPNAVRSNQFFAEALWAVAWSAFTFGSLGKRSRRGFGGFVIESFEGPRESRLPLFVQPPESAQVLASRLKVGFSEACKSLRAWLKAENRRRLAEDIQRPAHERKFKPLNLVNTGSMNGPETFFQIPGMNILRIGTEDGCRAYERMVNLGESCHAAVGTTAEDAEEFQAVVGAPLPSGAANRIIDKHIAQRDKQNGKKRSKIKSNHCVPARLASPLWFRAFMLRDRSYVLVVVASRRHPDSSSNWKTAEKLLSAVGATPDRTVAKLAAQAP